MHDHHEHHDHGDRPATTREEAVALLHYSLHHNEHHLSELTELAETMEREGLCEAAAKLRLAAERYGEGNSLLSEAFDLSREG
jgi:superfamily II RNA helicase